MNQNARRILLGPTNEVHIGVHLPLVALPPAGYEYVIGGATHYFLLPKGVQLFEPISPHRYFHRGERDYEGDGVLGCAVAFPLINDYVERFRFNPRTGPQSHAKC